MRSFDMFVTAAWVILSQPYRQFSGLVQDCSKLNTTIILEGFLSPKTRILHVEIKPHLA